MQRYARIERVLESLETSTYREVSLKGETVIFNGLRSEYISHKSVGVEPGHGLSQFVSIKNNRYWLGVTPLTYNKPIEGDVASATLPSYHLRELFEFPANKPKWVNGLVTVHILDTFKGFHEDGTPQFSAVGEVRVEGRVVYSTGKVLVDDWKSTTISRLNDGSVDFGPSYGRFKLWDELPESFVQLYMESSDEDSNRLDDVLEKEGILLVCPEDSDECTGNDCSRCKYRNRLLVRPKLF